MFYFQLKEFVSLAYFGVCCIGGHCVGAQADGTLFGGIVSCCGCLDLQDDWQWNLALMGCLWLWISLKLIGIPCIWREGYPDDPWLKEGFDCELLWNQQDGWQCNITLIFSL